MPFTREALCILQNYGIQPIILTKGGTRACRDFDILMAAGGWFGQTMSMLTVNYKQWEPNTATPFDREQAAGSARDKGINTWYSVEPVLDSGESLHVVATARHVCHFKLGKLSGYDKETKAIEKSINWYDYLMQATTILEEAGYERTCAPGTFEAGTYYIKAELVEAARVIGSRADERTEGEI